LSNEGTNLEQVYGHFQVADLSLERPGKMLSNARLKRRLAWKCAVGLSSAGLNARHLVAGT
jgi:hypothetical protein